MEGIAKENEWLDVHYPGHQKRGQALAYHDGKPYDIIYIVTADGEEKEVYFDISSFYGQW